MNKQTDTRKNKLKRLCTFLEERKGNPFSHTDIAHRINTHPDTIREFIDLFDTMKEAGIQSIRDKNGKLLKVMSTDDYLDSMKELREIRKGILDLTTKVDEIKSLNRKR